MTWFKVDDGLCNHPKARKAGLAAMGLWVVAGSYCSDQLTDGFVPEWFVQSWPSGKKFAAVLVAVRLWSVAECDGEKGWQFHDWEQSNPTRTQEEDRKEKERKRQQAWRDAHASDSATDTGSHTPGNASSNGASNDQRNALRTGAPTRPDPIKYLSGEGTSPEPPRTRPPRTCPQHANDPDPPNCGKCADARRGHDLWQAPTPTPPPMSAQIHAMPPADPDLAAAARAARQPPAVRTAS